MAGLKVLAKTSQKISIGADTFRLKVYPKLKEFADNNFQFDENGGKLPQDDRNPCMKGRKTRAY